MPSGPEARPRSSDHRLVLALFAAPVLVVAAWLVVGAAPSRAPVWAAEPDAGAGSATTTSTVEPPAAGGSSFAPARTTTTTARPTVVTTYLADCATCHGADARGVDGRGPSLRGADAGLVDYEISTGRMPLPRPGAKTVRRDPKYDPRTVAALDAYVVSLTGGDPALPAVGRGDVAKGGEQFRLQCAACHSWAGNGGALLDREAPSLRRSTSRQIAEAVRSGPGNMPAFGVAALDDRQLADVVAYVRTLRDPEDRGGFGLWHLGPFGEGAVGWVIALGGVLLGLRWIGTRR